MKKRNNYWKLRAINERRWQLKQLQKDSRFNKVLDRSYQIAIDNINKQIEHELNRVGGIRNLVTADQMAEYERLARQVVNRANIMRAQGKKVIKYSDFPQEINDRLRVYNATMRINQLELIKSEIGTHLLDLGMDIETKITDKVNADYFAEMKRQAGILRSTVSNNIWTSPAVIDRATANITVGAFSKNIWANIDNLKARLDGLVATAMIRGDNPKEMIKYLKPMVKKTVGDASYAAERIARTESSRVQHEAQVLSLKQNDYKYCKWYIEPGACKYCREIAHSNSGGNLPEGIYEVDDCPDIPVHPNCRCSIGAYWLDEESSVKKSEDEKVEKKNPFYEISKFTNADEALFNKKSNEWYQYLEEPEKKAVGEYISGSEGYNAWLRDGTKGWKDKYTEEQIDMAVKRYQSIDKNLNAAIDKAPKLKSFTTQRYVNKKEYEAYTKYAEDGKKHIFKNMKSTSPFNGSFKSDYKITYYIPEGTKGVYFGRDAARMFCDEKEFLVKSGQDFYVKNDGGKLFVYVQPKS